MFLVEGKVYTLPELCEVLGINKYTLLSRIYNGWDIDEAIYTPVRKRKKKVLEIFVPALTPGINRTYKRSTAGKIFKSKDATDWAAKAALIIGSVANSQDWTNDSEFYILDIIWWGGGHDRDAHTKLVQDTLTLKLGFDDRYISGGSAKRLKKPPKEYENEPVGILIRLYKE